MLLLQRPTGTWEPPAGRLQPGESFEEGAVRELYEETGMLVSPQRIIATWVGEAASGRRLASVTYAGKSDGAEVRLSEEHLDHRWVTLGEWMSLPSWWSHENIQRIAGPVGRFANCRTTRTATHRPYAGTPAWSLPTSGPGLYSWIL